MKTYRAATTIRAEPETIWRILTDAASYPAWHPEVLDVEGQFAPEETLILHRNAEPKVATVVVTAFDPPHRLALTGTGGMPAAMLKAVRTFTLEPAADGAVEFTQELVFSGMMAGMVTSQIPDQEPVMMQTGEVLKARAERAA
ncbi:MAG TPA: SRPBCC domain-containing protein [Hyphomicrobiales bacterium]